jgi:probable rRNA maturation factor
MSDNPIRLEANNRFERLDFTNESLIALVDHLHSSRPDHGLAGELSLAFLGDAELASIHADFLADPSPTDVITFPGEASDGLAGEICVSVERAEMEAVAQSEPFARELTLYLVHGWLHLVGFGDMEDADRLLMREAERESMGAIEKAGLIPDFRLAPKSLAE